MNNQLNHNDYLSDRHGAEDVEEDKGAVGVVFTQQVAVRQPLNVGQRNKRQFGHNPSIEAARQKNISTPFMSSRFLTVPSAVTKCGAYMELNMPIKAVKQKPIANMDFMRTWEQAQQ